MSGVWINATVTNTAAAPSDRVSAAVVPDRRGSMIIHNPSKSGFLAFTVDGTTPVIETNGMMLGPLGTTTADVSPLCGPLKMISDIATQSATIYYEEN